MSFNRSFLLVARREITQRVRERSFLVSGAVTLLIVVAVAILPALLGGDGPETYKVGVAGPEQRAVAAAADAAGGDLDARIEPRRVRDRAQAERLVRDGDLDAALLEGRVVISDEQLPDTLDSALQVGQRQVSTGATLRRQGLSESATRQVLDPPPLRTETLSGEEDEDQKRFIALATGVLLYMQLLTYGLWVATGVVEEKSSRVVEILLSTLSPRALMAGKIVGLGLLGMGQLLLVVAVGVGLALATGSLDANVDDVGPALLVLLWFPLGYALYASMYAAAAALVSRQEDLQSATTPLTIVIVASFFVSFSALEDPGGTLAQVASLVPFSAPLVMPGRMALGDAAPVEVAVAVLLIVATTILLVRVGARVYAGAILRTGKPVKLLEALRTSE
ncbi:MAG TPA: ABC transporter permease [Thermoleophilaceae bacterium]|nr:ABC transporter permease [Thermoleophilaceae bacterium]